MDGWVIRTPCPPPDEEPPATSTAPAPSRPHSARHASSQPPSARHASSQTPSARHTPSQLPTSQPTSQPASQPPSPRPPKHRIEVRIPARVDNPPQLQPLTLLPVHDSTAFIEDKMLLGSSGLAADGNPLPANMAYLVGWTDLRGARVIVPAGNVLDYVSPYALEQFEHEEWKRRKREEKEAQAELERIAEAKKVALETGQEARIPKKPGRPAGKRKRPGKNVEVPVDEGAIQEEVRKRAGSQVREGQPSLSTPQKGLKGLAGGTDDEPAAIYRQLYGETETETSYPVTSREESRELSEPPRKKLRSSSPMKEGFGEGPTSGMSPTPRAHLPMRGLSQSAPKSEASPTVTGFTPIMPPPPKAPLETPKARSPTAPESREASAGPKRAAKSKKRKTPGKPRTPKPPNGTKAQEAGEPEEVEYVVKRLEDMKEMVVDGARERYFQVRWEGNWPPDENPTWEPEENIPRKLVRRYLAKHAGGSAKKTEPGVRRYSSVMEAFEGGGEELGHGRTGVVADSQDEEEEEKFQVTEGSGAGPGMGAQGGTPSRILSRAFGFAFGRS